MGFENFGDTLGFRDITIPITGDTLGFRDITIPINKMILLVN